MISWKITLGKIAILAGAVAGTSSAMAEQPPPSAPAARAEAVRLDRLPPVVAGPVGRIDPSGRKQQGRASYYSRYFSNRLMADGRRMDPRADIAASRTLPLGTMATVTNLDNGKSATVKVEDRGPYIKGRVVDLSPAVAAKLDITKHGVVPVEVKPITVPQLDGAVKLGAGAADASPEEVAQATDSTRQLIEPQLIQTTRR
jgi:rare lipoprotein A